MIDNEQILLNLNKFFDKIVCINLKKRPEKRDFIKTQAKEYDLDIEFFDAIEIPENPAKGCLKSHLNILKQAKKDKLNKILQSINLNRAYAYKRSNKKIIACEEFSEIIKKTNY